MLLVCKKHWKSFLRNHKTFFAKYVFIRLHLVALFQIHHTISFTEFHIDWMSPEEVYMHRENTSSQIYRGITASLGFKKPLGQRLFRGYREVCQHTDRLADIKHLVRYLKHWNQTRINGWSKAGDGSLWGDLGGIKAMISWVHFYQWGEATTC